MTERSVPKVATNIEMKPVNVRQPWTSGISSGAFPLTHPQRRVWFTELMFPGLGVSNLSGCLYFPESSDSLELLCRAINTVVQRNDALNMRLRRTGTSTCEQYLTSFETHTFTVIRGKDWREKLLEESQRPFELFDSPLYHFRLLELPEDRIGFFFKYHHITIDALSVSFINKQIHAEFKAFLEGRQHEPGDSSSFVEVFERERDYLASEQFRADEIYWRGAFNDLGVIGAEARPIEDIRTLRFEHRFSAELTSSIAQFCKRNETSVFRFFLAVFAITFARAAGRPDAVMSTGHHNRMSPREKTMAGMTVSTVPLRFSVRDDEPFISFLKRVHSETSDFLAHQRYPYDLLARHLRAMGHDPRQLLRYFVNHIPSFDGDYTVERYSPGADLAELNIKINPNQRPKTAPLELCVDARKGLWDESRVRLLFSRWEGLVNQVLEHPQRPVGQLDVLAPEEQQRALESARPQKQEAPPFLTVLDGFERAARQHPSRLALSDMKSGLTYLELFKEVQAIATHIRLRGPKRGDAIALVMDHSADFAVAALAVMRAGCAYVPISPETPEDRLRFIIDDVDAAFVITDVPSPLLVGAVPMMTMRELRNFDQSAPDSNRDAAYQPVGPEDLAYIIYTSGTTGRPKGVQILHRGLANLVVWNAQICDIKPSDRASAYCSFMFDVSVAELFTPIVCGAAVFVIPSDMRRSVRDVADFFVQHEITVATLPTRVGELLIEHVKQTPLRLLTVAGEKLQRFQPRPYRLINAYGPTEATVYATVHDVKRAEKNIPIGMPASNMWAYIVDDKHRLVALGEEGELLLTGPQVARGYVNNVKETKKAFIKNPFAKNDRNAVAYKTGDRVRRQADGSLVFLGRRDRQLKIRGFRVELQEIEHCLATHPEVESCVATSREDASGAAITAFCATSNQTSRDALWRFAQSRLPSFMCPSQIVTVATIPLGPEGKTDWDALWAEAPSRSADLPNAAQKPRTRAEADLLALWQEILGRRDLGVTDDFFEVGGDSLSAMSLFALIEQRLGAQRPVALIFRYPTVEKLAAVLKRPKIGDDKGVILIKKGTAPPIFCIHDFSCDIMPYTNLARSFKGSSELRGVRWARKLADGAETMEQLARRYTTAIRTTQPTGPYHLLGYSIGGTIAYEMARILREQGERIGFLGLIDTPNYAANRRLLERFAMNALKNILAWFRGMSLNYKLLFFASGLHRLTRTGGFADLLRSQRRLKSMLASYNPQSLDADLTLFASETPRPGLANDMGWRHLASSMSIRRLRGNHVSIMNKANAVELADHLRHELDQKGRKDAP